MPEAERPLFSVIIPTHERPGLLPRAVASVLGQTVTDLDVLVVDDASAVPPVLHDDPRVRLLRREVNGGPAACRNDGARAARGRYLAFLDDDDVWVPHRLELALDGLARTPITMCWARYLDEPPAPKRVLDGDVRDVILDGVTPSLIATAVARQVFVPLDERYRGSEDVDWWLRMTQRHEVATVPRVGALVRRRPAAEAEAEAGAEVGPASSRRLVDGVRLLDDHAAWFDAHPRAAAMRWQRIGLTAGQCGDRRLACRALLRSLRLRPRARPALHLARTLVGGRSPR